MAFLPLYFPAIPFDTAKAAWGIFRRYNFYRAIGEQANCLFDGIRLVDPAGRFRKPPHTMAMLYLITAFQYMEMLPDALAAEAVQKRVDWKYALHLPLNYPDMKAASLCEFRGWLVVEPAAQRSLQLLLNRLSEVADCPARLRSGREASQVISTVCQTSRLAVIWEALNKALKALATWRPEWLVDANLPRWFERYSDFQGYLELGADRLARHAMFHNIGVDGFYLLRAISESSDPVLANLPAVLNLQRVWDEQYEQVEGKVQWRREACASCPLYSLMPLSTAKLNYDIHITARVT